MAVNELDVLISLALTEDIGSGDLTGAATVGEGTRARARIVQKRAGVVFGFEVASAVFGKLDPDCQCRTLAVEGEWRDEVPVDVIEITGDGRALLAGERVALNFLQHLSGVATMTARAVSEVAGTGVQILDTRKTLPGLRQLEKQAVLAGGGRNHRMGLYDAILVKENNAALAGGLAEATKQALKQRPAGVSVEVECRSLAEVEMALTAGADRLLLDNMSPAQLEQAVALAAGRAELEASGGLTLETLRAVADTGVQFISMGALTHSAEALDLSMVIEPA